MIKFIDPIHMINNDEIDDNDMYRQLYDESIRFDVEHDGEIKTTIIESQLSVLSLIDNFVKMAVSSKQPAFRITRLKSGGLEIRTLPLGRYFTLVKSFSSCITPHYRYSENVELFIHCWKALNLEEECFEMGVGFPSKIVGRCVAERFNELVELIRAESQTPEFKLKAARREFNAKRNYLSATSYVDNLFVRYSRLLVLRMDFSYRADVSMQMSAEDADKDITRFLNNRRSNKLFAAWVGYICKFEYGSKKGFHFHMILFFDGSKVRNDAYLANELGRYWKERITQGRGLFSNCNLSKSKYKNIGIGMISHNDTEIRNTLVTKVIKYLTKQEQYLIATKLENGFKTFRKGESPYKMSRAGRKRKGITND